MQIARRFTKAGQDVFDSVQWTKRSSKISNLDGSVVFEMNDAQVPASWSQLATDIMVSKYFRKAGVPQVGDDGQVLKDEQGNVVTGPERSVKQVVNRLAGCWRHWGQKQGYFSTQEDGQAFYDELCYMLLHQMAAPNSPQWFNTGLHQAYGISGPAQGHWVTDEQTGQTHEADDAYTHPQPHACFIQSVEDDLVNPGGIMDLWVREARLFKYGSGTGSNFSKLRGEDESLSGGGKSSGLMSWLRIGDRAAGAIKSGGTTRRAAKMVCLDLDHPDIEMFIDWKVREELKVAALAEGLKHLSKEQKETAKELDLQLDYDFNGEAYQTVSGQNSNNSVRITNQFFNRLDENAQWDLIGRVDGKTAKSIPARQLWDKITQAAWHCADPGVQYDTTINQWHTCPASGRINASNPCSEYMFLDNTACNLASFNLLKFFDAQTQTFNVDDFEHATHLWTIVLEISVAMASFPSQAIARLSYEYRTLGLGYANIGAMLMQLGIAYDSDKARGICSAITAILTGRSYATSAQMAGELGPFPGYYKNREHMLRVIRNHRRAAYGVWRDAQKAENHELGSYEGLEIHPVPIERDDLLNQNDNDALGHLANSEVLLQRAQGAWDDALKLGSQHGYRNAQTTVIAPTGTIGLLMDCDTTGVEPDFALVKFKKLAGGGYFKIANQSLKPALQTLGYDAQQVKDIMVHVMGKLSLDVPMPNPDGSIDPSQSFSFEDYLKEKGLLASELKKLVDILPTLFELQHAFTVWTVGQEAMDRLELTKQATLPGFSLLKALSLTRLQIKALNQVICGSQTVEGAPHFKAEHEVVFDCANTCGPTGKRFIQTQGHIRMMAAAQPFISGAISKTINLPNSATVDDIKQAYRLSWELGLKANALYRDGCKLSQPLNTSAEDDAVEDDDAVAAGQVEVAGEVAQVANQIAHSGSVDASASAKPIEKVVERIIERPMRRRLPDTRQSLTHKFNVAGHEGYLTVGLYEQGSPGELFITMAKEGSTIGGLMDSLGTAISVALQYGVPVESLVTKFTHQRFEPAGMTHNRDIPFAKSLVDYIFRWMGMEFIPGYRQANAPKRTTPKATAKATVPVNDADKKAASVLPNTQAGQGKSPGNGGSDPTDSIVDPPRRSAETVASQADKMVKQRVADDVLSAGSQPHTGDTTTQSAGSLMTALREMQTDAPACDTCGTITVRSGTCYKCLNCGNSMGCS